MEIPACVQIGEDRFKLVSDLSLAALLAVATFVVHDCADRLDEAHALLRAANGAVVTGEGWQPGKRGIAADQLAEGPIDAQVAVRDLERRAAGLAGDLDSLLAALVTASAE